MTQFHNKYQCSEETNTVLNTVAVHSNQKVWVFKYFCISSTVTGGETPPWGGEGQKKKPGYGIQRYFLRHSLGRGVRKNFPYRYIQNFRETR